MSQEPLTSSKSVRNFFSYECHHSVNGDGMQHPNIYCIRYSRFSMDAYDQHHIIDWQSLVLLVFTRSLIYQLGYTTMTTTYWSKSKCTRKITLLVVVYCLISLVKLNTGYMMLMLVNNRHEQIVMESISQCNICSKT